MASGISPAQPVRHSSIATVQPCPPREYGRLSQLTASLQSSACFSVVPMQSRSFESGINDVGAAQASYSHGSALHCMNNCAQGNFAGEPKGHDIPDVTPGMHQLRHEFDAPADLLFTHLGILLARMTAKGCEKQAKA